MIEKPGLPGFFMLLMLQANGLNKRLCIVTPRAVPAALGG